MSVVDELALVSAGVVPDGLVLDVAEDVSLPVDGVADGVDGVVVAPDIEGEFEAGGVTVTLLLVAGVSEGDLLHAASDSADSKASASIEGRFIGSSWSR